MRRLLLLILLLPAACGTTSSGTTSSGTASSGSRLSCAPFVRELTGLPLHGDAASWWQQADGRYARTRTPQVGSVIVFARTARLPSGHVSVVSALRGPREIAVIQANWVPGELERDRPVIDVSPGGDWSFVRVWWQPVQAMGARVYPVSGFIVPPVPLGHDALAEGAEAAAARADARAGG